MVSFTNWAIAELTALSAGFRACEQNAHTQLGKRYVKDARRLLCRGNDFEVKNLIGKARYHLPYAQAITMAQTDEHEFNKLAATGAE